MWGWAKIRLKLHGNRAICLNLGWGLHQYIFNITNIWKLGPCSLHATWVLGSCTLNMPIHVNYYM